MSRPFGSGLADDAMQDLVAVVEAGAASESFDVYIEALHLGRDLWHEATNANGVAIASRALDLPATAARAVLMSDLTQAEVDRRARYMSSDLGQWQDYRLTTILEGREETFSQDEAAGYSIRLQRTLGAIAKNALDAGPRGRKMMQGTVAHWAPCTAIGAPSTTVRARGTSSAPSNNTCSAGTTAARTEPWTWTRRSRIRLATPRSTPP